MMASVWDGRSPPHAKFWLQTLAGNWSPEAWPPNEPKQNPPTEVSEHLSRIIENQQSFLQRFGYAFSIVLAILLNNALYVVILGPLWRLTGRNRALELADALVLKDIFVKEAVRDLLEEGNFPEEEQGRIAALVDKAFERGREETVKHLPAAGESAAGVLDALGLKERVVEARLGRAAPYR